MDIDMSSASSSGSTGDDPILDRMEYRQGIREKLRNICKIHELEADLIRQSSTNQEKVDKLEAELRHLKKKMDLALTNNRTANMRYNPINNHSANQKRYLDAEDIATLKEKVAEQTKNADTALEMAKSFQSALQSAQNQITDLRMTLSEVTLQRDQLEQMR